MTDKTVLPATIYSIGHSNHPIERFIALLRGAGIEAVLDVRSVPQSRYVPQFGRQRLEAALAAAGLGYVFLGDALGGKPAAAGTGAEWQGTAVTNSKSTDDEMKGYQLSSSRSPEIQTSYLRCVRFSM